ncbi:MAG: hypothetical protein HRT88_11960 [Lentisphaeraceae bacterium]|nr:hypothetical protein [Lentisphaeraceae bacterium]
MKKFSLVGFKKENYIALDRNGHEYEREVREVNELSTPTLRLKALKQLTPLIAQVIGIEYRTGMHIEFGTPVHLGLGINVKEAKKHKDIKLLMTKGCSLKINI